MLLQRPHPGVDVRLISMRMMFYGQATCWRIFFAAMSMRAKPGAVPGSVPERFQFFTEPAEPLYLIVLVAFADAIGSSRRCGQLKASPEACGSSGMPGPLTTERLFSVLPNKAVQFAGYQFDPAILSSTPSA
jgi:hypothetical protein